MIAASLSAGVLVELVARLIPQFQERLREPVAEFPADELRRLAACGALTAALPPAAGGLGPRDLLFLLHSLGRGNQVVGRLFEGHVNALLLIDEYGSDEQRAQLTRDVLERQAMFGVWNTGPAGKPALTRQPEGSYRLSGGKTFASGAGKIQRALVTCASEGGWQMCVVPLDQVEYAIDFDSWHPMGMEASDSFTVDLTGVEIGPEALIGQPNQYYVEPLFTGGAFRFSAVQLGGAEALFDFCREYLRNIRYDNDPHQQERMGRMAVAVESGRLWMEQAARWLEEEGGGSQIKHRARMMRVATHEICSKVMELTQVSIGARGLQGPQPFGRMLRDLQMYLRQAGHDQAITSIGRAAFDQV